MLKKFFLVMLASCCSSGLPDGHGKPLGEHNDLGTPNIEDDFENLIPKLFYEKYVYTRTPVIFRGLAKTFPAFDLWTDEYIMKNYGDLVVRLEAKKEKESHVPVGEVGMGRSTFTEFLSRYKTDNMYCVSEVPGPMYKDLELPQIMNCGGLQKSLAEMNLWINSGGAKSIIHKDAHNQLNCLLAGSKDWIFINNSYNDWIYQAEEIDGDYGGYSLVNPDEVNYITFPNFEKIPWTYATVHAGDCLYLPPRYYHRVKSTDRNFAVSFLFGTKSEFDMAGCGTLTESVNLENVPIEWKYPGHGVMSMGNDPPVAWKSEFTELFQANFKHEIAIEDFYSALHEKIEEFPFVPVLMKKILLVDSVFGAKISLDLFEKTPMETWKIIAAAASFDPSNHPNMEFYHIEADEIRKVMIDAVKGQTINVNKFLQIYTETPFNGSLRVGKELFAEIAERQGTINYEQMQQTTAFNVFSMTHDRGDKDMQKRNEAIRQKAEAEMLAHKKYPDIEVRSEL